MNLKGMIFNKEVRNLAGALTVIGGTMFGGKTTELITRANIIEKYMESRVFYFKPAHDTRDSKEIICSHDGRSCEVINVKNSQEILEIIAPHNNKQIFVIIDELQFFDKDIVGVIRKILGNGHDVIAGGLLKDYMGNSFENTSILMDEAENPIYKNAICTFQINGKRCGEKAIFNQRIDVYGKPVIKSGEIVQVGAAESYQPRCREHFVWPKNS